MVKVLLALFFIVILTAPGLTWWVAQRPVPTLDGVAEINGMQRPVLIRYDARAIPYIKAESDEDLYAAQGYVVARERMFQMDTLRRTAEGRMAEVFGITALPADRLNRTMGFERLAQAELNNLTPQAKAAVEAYTRGVNAYLSDSGDKLPLEFTALTYRPEPWREVDTLAVLKYLAYELDESWKLDELRWRVTNHVGDNLAGRMFKDDLSVCAWSPDVKGKVAPAVTSTSAGTSVTNAAAKSTRAPLSNKAKSPSGSRALPGGAIGPRPMIRHASPVSTRSPATTTSPASPADTPATPPPGASLPRNNTLGSNTNSSRNSSRLNDESRNSLEEKLAALAKQPEFLRKPDPSWGSTAWVLAPAYSKSGGAMLASDKHTELSTPCEYFLCELTSNGLHVAGAALPGVPGILFGRNQNVSWSGAAMHADVQDLFVEHFASEIENKYKTPEKVEVAKETHEAIPIRFGKDVDHKITVTKHGPLLLRDKDSAIALSWTGFEAKKPWLNTICALNRAGDWNTFCQTLSTYAGPPQLFVFADKRGNTGCHAAGILPIRAGGAQGTTMSEGWSAKGEWVGSVDFADLPTTFIPAGTTGRASGDFCVAAGQKLDTGSGGNGQAQLWGHQWDPPYRANRLALSLPSPKNAQKLDLFDFNAYQGDELNMMASLVASELKKSMDANKSIDATQVQAMKLMQHWDFNIKHDSAAATCYESFVGALARRLIEQKLGHEMANEYFQNWPLWTTFVEDYLRNKPKDLLPDGERTHDTFMLDTFTKSNSRLKLLFETNANVENWQWEKAHLANFRAVGLQSVAWLRKVLEINNIGVGGDSNCLNACDIDRLSVGGAFRCNNGPSVRLLIDMSDDDAFYGNLALGQSGHYFSPYRQDQLKSWLRADPLPIAFSEAQIDKQCRQKFYLSAPGNR